MEWFSAKCIFHYFESAIRRQIYEERIILLQAESFEDAVIKAEKEAKHYCRYLDDCEYTGFVEVFKLYEEKITNNAEIFSTMRASDLSPDDFLNHFYPNEPENCEEIGKTHRWHNKDNKTEACYHCAAIRQK